MKNYIISIVAAAMICGAVSILLPTNTSAGQVTKLLCGVLLTATVIAPLTNISFRHITDYFDTLSLSAEGYAETGSTAAREQINAIIKSQTEAYILDKANSMGLQIGVEVALDENNDSIPCGVTISGKLSPYTKQVLSGYITDTLGIAKEKQEWISKG